MSKLRCHISISLDGFVAGPSGRNLLRDLRGVRYTTSTDVTPPIPAAPSWSRTRPRWILDGPLWLRLPSHNQTREKR